MPSIRKVKTGSGATAVQVVQYSCGKRIVIRHLGSARSPAELTALLARASSWVEQASGQMTLFPKAATTKKRALFLEDSRLLRTTHLFARTFLHACASECGLGFLEPLILDFAVMRIIEPSSKARAFELIERAFGVRHSRRGYAALRALHSHKDAIERAALACARVELREDLFFVLYDVTTLYFETFKADDLRSLGFSKDDKSKQPQIVIGLLTTKSGFPLAHEVFPGKTFEGSTMLSVLETFSKKNSVAMPIVVADAAMLSKDNIQELATKQMSYIVGGRLANTSPSFIRKVSEGLSGRDGAILRLSTRQHGDMICSYSAQRYRKDKHEMEKQIERAKRLIAKNEAGRRAKFVQKADGAVEINRNLVSKTESLLGIKGYCTNIPEATLSNADVIACYHALWNVEHAFRMSKHDLEARPIFHRKAEAVRAHVLLCFAALMMGRYLEISTGMSLRKVRDLLWSIEEAHLEDTITHEVHQLRMPLDTVLESPLGALVKKWGC